jgi:hypothetical protein
MTSSVIVYIHMHCNKITGNTQGFSNHTICVKCELRIKSAVSKILIYFLFFKMPGGGFRVEYISLEKPIKLPKTDAFRTQKTIFKIIEASFYCSQLKKQKQKTDYCALSSCYELVFLGEDGAWRLRSKNKTNLYH